MLQSKKFNFMFTLRNYYSYADCTKNLSYDFFSASQYECL